MPKPLNTEQLAALRAVPLGTMPNKLRIALAMTGAKQDDIVNETELSAAQVSSAVTGKGGATPVHHARLLSRFFACSIEDLFPEPDADPSSDRRAGERRSGDERRASHDAEHRTTDALASPTETGEAVAQGTVVRS